MILLMSIRSSHPWLSATPARPHPSLISLRHTSLYYHHTYYKLHPLSHLSGPLKPLLRAKASTTLPILDKASH